MTNTTNESFDAKALSKLGIAFDNRVKEETAALQSDLDIAARDLAQERKTRSVMEVQIGSLALKIDGMRQVCDQIAARGPGEDEARAILEMQIAGLAQKIDVVQQAGEQTAARAAAESKARATTEMRIAGVAQKIDDMQRVCEQAIVHAETGRDQTLMLASELRTEIATVPTTILRSLGQALEDALAPKASPLPEAIVWLTIHGETAMARLPMAELEVTTAYYWPDEMFIAAAFEWLLDRKVEKEGLFHYCQKLRSGMLRRDLLCDIAASGEAQHRLREICDTVDDGAFLLTAYQKILGRPVEPSGLEHYLPLLARGTRREKVLLGIARSGEARSIGLPAASALRAIAEVATAFKRFERTLDYAVRRLGFGQQMWQAGRLAAIEGVASRAYRETGRQMEVIGASISRLESRSQYPSDQATARPGQPIQRGLPPLLRETSEGRQVKDIRHAIRMEIQQQGTI